jgi:peptidoglycan LD-endopeptidase CwlK
MSVGVSSKANLNLLYPPFRLRVNRLLDVCREKNIPIFVTHGFRTSDEQDKLYEIGRNGNPGRPVTQVRGMGSLHCWGLAIDFCKNAKDSYSDDVFFLTVGEMAEKACDMVWAGRWSRFKELAHLEEKGFTADGLLKKYGTLEKFLKTWETWEPKEIWEAG